MVEVDIIREDMVEEGDITREVTEVEEDTIRVAMEGEDTMVVDTIKGRDMTTTDNTNRAIVAIMEVMRLIAVRVWELLVAHAVCYPAACSESDLTFLIQKNQIIRNMGALLCEKGMDVEGQKY